MYDLTEALKELGRMYKARAITFREMLTASTLLIQLS